MNYYWDDIASAVFNEHRDMPESRGASEFSAAYPLGDFTAASFSAAAASMGYYFNKRPVLNRRLALLWYSGSLYPKDWKLPDVWDEVAGVYESKDGFIRLHTNAPNHKTAALSVLKSSADKSSVKQKIIKWEGEALEEAIVSEGGCAAILRTESDWLRHPQGKVLSDSPLIKWKYSQSSRPFISDARIKVLDLTRVIAGPVSARFLAAFGADVLRIDPPNWNEDSILHETTLGKTCAGLDLKLAEDRVIFEILLKEADVLLHGYRPGALENLGYGEEERRRINPTLVDVSLSAYGDEGVWGGRRGFDSIVQMSTGIAYRGMKVFGGIEPIPLPVQALDHSTGYLMAAAVYHGLSLREKGVVSSVKLSLARTAIELMKHKDVVEQNNLELTKTDCIEEDTPYGKAARLNFPITLDEKQVKWTKPIGELRRHKAAWIT